MVNLEDMETGTPYKVFAEGNPELVGTNELDEFDKVSFVGTPTNEWRIGEHNVHERKFIYCHSHSYSNGSDIVWAGETKKR